jgi:predicted RNA-binding protein with RPS1 domain
MDKGNIVKGEITAIKPYGAFVKIGTEHVGLIHISEISDGFVRNVEDYVTIGDVLDLKVLDVKGNKLSLSFKAIHKRKKRYNITLQTGFSPLQERLDQWIEEYILKDDE